MKFFKNEKASEENFPVGKLKTLIDK